MTPRVCLIGDSHLACLQLASQTRDSRTAELVFFAHTRQRLRALQVHGEVLRAGTEDLRQALEKTSGGIDHIDLRAFDVCILMALGREFPHHCLRGQFFSRAVVEQTVRDAARDSLARNVLGKIRQVSCIPVLMLHMPLLEHRGQPYRPEILSYERFQTLSTEAFGEYEVVLLRQPDSTIVAGCYTPLEFSRSPIGFGKKTGKAELIEETVHRHKNGRFGAIVLDDLLARL